MTEELSQATILFTDIVDSTSIQVARGDQEWKRILESHNAIIRFHLSRHGGREQDTAGDGFYVVFESPADAIRCVHAIIADLEPLGIEIRAGVHAGDCLTADGKCTGLAVSTGARITALARPSQVLISQGARDAIDAGIIRLGDHGLHELRGIPGREHLYTVDLASLENET